MTLFKFMKHLTAAALLALLLVPSIVYAQKTTEQYIPIGESPGVSTKYSYIGTIVAVDESTHTIVVRSNRGEKSIKVTDATRLWLDRTKARQSNQPASFEDCEVGRSVEVMHEMDDADAADWVKIEE